MQSSTEKLLDLDRQLDRVRKALSSGNLISRQARNDNDKLTLVELIGDFDLLARPLR